jgi:radical SAM protein with 4Fe4S-binding SPASM domain
MSCELPKVSGHTVRSRMQAAARAQRVPMQADIEIIATCNYKCVHCYIAPCAHREDVMSLAQAKVILRKLADAGTLAVLLTGGEVFTHKQFKDIYLEAKRLGFVVYVNTNGYLLGKRWADFFEQYPPSIVSISLYGASDETYSRVTGIPNSWQRCVNAIDLLLERGINVDLKCPAFSHTVDDLPAMKAFAAERGIEFRWDPMITPQRFGGAEPVQLQLAPSRMVALEKSMDPGFEKLRAFADGRIFDHTGPRKVYQCGAGVTGLAIDCKGNVSTCLSSRMTVGNLLDQSWDDVWGALGGKVNRVFPDGHPCATCKFRAMCAGCPATVEQLTGLPEGYVQHYCKVTHLQAYELGYHPTGVPRTVTEGVPTGVRTTSREFLRALPVIS